MRPLRLTPKERRRVARLVEAERKRLGVTKADLAGLLRVHPSEYSKILGGKAHLGRERASRLVMFLGMDSVDDLLGRPPGSTKGPPPPDLTPWAAAVLVEALAEWLRAESPEATGRLLAVRSLFQEGRPVGEVMRMLKSEANPMAESGRLEVTPKPAGG